MSKPTISPREYTLGDTCLCWSLGESIDEEINRRILLAYRRLRHPLLRRLLGIRDVVPSYNSLALHIAPGRDPARVRRWAGRVLERVARMPAVPVGRGRRHLLPVHYTGEDLPRVAAHCGLSVEEVIQRHCAVEYIVAMVGFRPHFPYLLGMDPRLTTPRLDSPRTRVPAGAVAIGGEQTGVYPEVSPGGWNIVGMTDPRLLHAVRPGDRIRFHRREA